VEEHPPSKLKALSSNPRIAKRKKDKKSISVRTEEHKFPDQKVSLLRFPKKKKPTGKRLFRKIPEWKELGYIHRIRNPSNFSIEALKEKILEPCL
jgi:hypothetical protein